VDRELGRIFITRLSCTDKTREGASPRDEEHSKSNRHLNEPRLKKEALFGDPERKSCKRRADCLGTEWTRLRRGGVRSKRRRRTNGLGK